MESVDEITDFNQVWKDTNLLYENNPETASCDIKKRLLSDMRRRP